MFFAKKAEQAVSTAPDSLEWEQSSRRSQSTRVVVSSWFIKTTPMLKYPSGCKVEITFEGRARLGTTPSVPVYGEISVSIDDEPVGYLADRWTKVPECVEGHAHLSLEAVGAPQLFVTLYCTAAAMDWVQRVLTAGFSTVGGRAALDITFGYPDDMDENFWAERWQQETLLVHTWDVRASADRNSN